MTNSTTTSKAYQVDCPTCGRPIGAVPQGEGAVVKVLRHKDFSGGEGWCAGSDQQMSEFREVAAQGRKAKAARSRLPKGKDGAKYEPVCLWCGEPIDPVTYWRGIDPDLPTGGFAAVCGESCTQARGPVLEQAGVR